MVKRAVIIAVVLVCIGGLVLAGQLADTGSDNGFITSGSAVEQRIPERGSEILRQEPVGIDLAPGFTAVLIVNGTEIPQDQISFRQGVDEYTYSAPEDGSGAVNLGAGENCVEALVWPVELTREDARTVSWCFNVT